MIIEKPLENWNIEGTKKYVRYKLKEESTEHGWRHAFRVCRLAVYIGEREKADLYVVQLAALLHDIGDWKFYQGDETVGPKMAREWLEGWRIRVEGNIISHVCEIIKDISFKGAGVKSEMKTLEGMVVQDADRLDAIGAIGIARTIAYGGKFDKPIYNPDIPPKQYNSFEEYKKGSEHSINHFYEKILLLKDLMNTETAKRIAEERHKFVERFLCQFFREWNGEDLD